MPVRMRTVRLVLGLALALAFFGCVGMPRRRPPTEGVRPGGTRQQDQSQAGDVSPREANALRALKDALNRQREANRPPSS